MTGIREDTILKHELAKKNPPAHGTIFNYWEQVALAGATDVEDLDYLFLEKIKDVLDINKFACWACGFVPLRFLAPASSTLTLRRAKRYLERAHIVPRVCDGAYEASNFLLLCKSCHIEAPDHPNSTHIKKWFIEKEEFFASQLDRFQKKFDIDEISFLGKQPMEDIVEFLRQHASGYDLRNREWLAETHIAVLR